MSEILIPEGEVLRLEAESLSIEFSQLVIKEVMGGLRDLYFTFKIKKN
jgi:hypothetical protein